MEESAERDHQRQLLEDLFASKEDKPEATPPAISAPSPDELVAQSREAKRNRQEKRVDAITRRQGRR
jgi:hypothetical protein